MKTREYVTSYVKSIDRKFQHGSLEVYEWIFLNSVCSGLDHFPACQNILEIGSYNYCSSSSFLEAMQNIPEMCETKFTSVDPVHQGWRFPDKKVDSRWEKIEQPSQEYLPTIVEEEEFDLIFIDGWHKPPIIFEDGRNARRLIRDNGLVVFHDTNCIKMRNQIATLSEEVSEYNDVVYFDLSRRRNGKFQGSNAGGFALWSASATTFEDVVKVGNQLNERCCEYRGVEK